MVTRRKYLMTILLSLLAILFLLASFGFFGEQDTRIKLKILSDSTTLPSVMILCIYGLLHIKGMGFFSIFGYGISRLSVMLTPRLSKAPQSYYEYKQEKKEHSEKDFSFLLHIGIILLIFSVIFTFSYYM